MSCFFIFFCFFIYVLMYMLENAGTALNIKISFEETVTYNRDLELTILCEAP